MASKYDFAALKAARFQTDNRAHLVKCHETMFGYAPEPTDSIEDILSRLQLAITQEAQADALRAAEAKLAEETKAPPLDHNVVALGHAKLLDFNRLPNLGPNGKWEGRCRRVRWHKDPRDTEQVITVRWETVKQDLLHNLIVDMPWPLWEALRRSVDRKISRRYTHDTEEGPNEGRLMLTEKVTEVPKYNIEDMGDVPGTAELPISYTDYFQRVAAQTRCFAGVSRAMLLKIHGLLYGTKPISDFANVDNLNIRVEISVMLGPDYEQMMTAELYAQPAVAASA